MQRFTIYLFISVRRPACFRRFFCPSSGARNSTYSIRYWSDKYLTLYVQFWAPDDGRKNRLKHAERLKEINKLWNVASCWLYSVNVLVMHWPMNVKFKENKLLLKTKCCAMWHFHVCSEFTMLCLPRSDSLHSTGTMYQNTFI